MVLASCTHICRALDGESVPIDAAKRKELESYITTLAKQSLRTIRWGVWRRKRREGREGGGVAVDASSSYHLSESLRTRVTTRLYIYIYIYIPAYRMTISVVLTLVSSLLLFSPSPPPFFTSSFSYPT